MARLNKLSDQKTVGGDQYWGSTALLIKGDQYLQDETGRFWTGVGSVTVSTSVSKFGGSLSFPNSPLSYISTARTSNLEIGTGDFTLEWWLYPTASPTGSSPQYNSSLYSTRGAANAQAGFIAVMTPARQLALYADAGSQNWGVFSGTALTTSSIPLNAWTHVALTRSGSTWKGWFNGQLEVTVTQSGIPNSTSGEIFIGGDPGGERFVGNMDDVRLTRAVRYTTNFTPPTATYAVGWLPV